MIPDRKPRRPVSEGKRERNRVAPQVLGKAQFESRHGVGRRAEGDRRERQPAQAAPTPIGGPRHPRLRREPRWNQIASQVLGTARFGSRNGVGRRAEGDRGERQPAEAARISGWRSPPPLSPQREEDPIRPTSHWKGSILEPKRDAGQPGGPSRKSAETGRASIRPAEAGRRPTVRRAMARGRTGALANPRHELWQEAARPAATGSRRSNG